MLKTLLLGSPSAFTSIVLQDLISASVPVVGVVLHRPRLRGRSPDSGDLPVANATGVEAIAGGRGIPLIALDEGSEALAFAAAARQVPDVLAIACYPRILGEHWLNLAPLGAFNLHPSLLPAYRGPSPLFWQFRNGERRMGMTLHRASAAVDAGPVVSTAEVPVAPGESASEVLAVLVRRGAALLAEALARIEAGSLRERAQDEAWASRYGWPDTDAFRIPTSWSAERAFRFMRGVREWGRVFIVETQDEILEVERALDFEERAALEGRVRREKRIATIGFAAGALRVRCAPASRQRRRTG